MFQDFWQALSLPSHLLVAYSVNQAVGRQVALRIMNTSNCDITLQAGQHIGKYCPLLDTLSSVDTQGTPLPKYAKAFSCQPANKVSLTEELKAVISPSLNDHDRQVILNTLLKYTNVFDESLGYTDVITHTINTGNNDPIRQYPSDSHTLIEMKSTDRFLTCWNRGLSNKVLLYGPPP